MAGIGRVAGPGEMTAAECRIIAGPTREMKEITVYVRYLADKP